MTIFPEIVRSECRERTVEDMRARIEWPGLLLIHLKWMG